MTSKCHNPACVSIHMFKTGIRCRYAWLCQCVFVRYSVCLVYLSVCMGVYRCFIVQASTAGIGNQLYGAMSAMLYALVSRRR